MAFLRFKNIYIPGYQDRNTTLKQKLIFARMLAWLLSQGLNKRSKQDGRFITFSLYYWTSGQLKVTLLHIVAWVSWFPLYARVFIWLIIDHNLDLILAVRGKKKVGSQQFPFKDMMWNANTSLMFKFCWPELSQLTELSCKGRWEI